MSYLLTSLFPKRHGTTKRQIYFKEFLRGERSNQLTSNHGWPKQDSPSPKSKKLWSKTIRDIFQFNSESVPIVYMLKEWIQSIYISHTLHEWYYSEKN